jgi:RNA polymerase sigma-70 factor (ECF subfamily)
MIQKNFAVKVANTVSSPDSHGQPLTRRWSHLTALLVRAQQGDRSAFTRVVEESRPALSARLRRCEQTRGIADDLDDALQEGALHAWQTLDLYLPERGSAMTWLWALTRNAAIDLLRRRKRKRHLDLDHGKPIESREPDPTTLAETEEEVERLRRRLREALATASPTMRQACELRLMQGKKYEDISRELGIPTGSLAGRIHRFKKELQAEIA